MGRRYMEFNGLGKDASGLIAAPKKSRSLLDAYGRWFTRSKPSYEHLSANEIIVVTANGRVKNDGNGDQTDAINLVLKAARGKPVFFPAGIYACKGTIEVPEGSIIIGEAWSQIMAVGDFFGNEKEPQVLFRYARLLTFV